MTEKRYGPPSPADMIAGFFRRRGVDVDPQRLEDRAAAVRSREKANRAASSQRARDLAAAVKAVRRECELAEFDWRRKPTADNLARARAAQRARSDVEAELRELCLQNDDLFADLIRAVGGR